MREGAFCLTGLSGTDGGWAGSLWWLQLRREGEVENQTLLLKCSCPEVTQITSAHVSWARTVIQACESAGWRK